MLCGISSAHPPGLNGFLTHSKDLSNRAVSREDEMVESVQFSDIRVWYYCAHTLVPSSFSFVSKSWHLLPHPLPRVFVKPLSFKFATETIWHISQLENVAWRTKTTNICSRLSPPQRRRKRPRLIFKVVLLVVPLPLAEVTCSQCQMPFPTAVWWFCVTGLIVKSGISF